MFELDLIEPRSAMCTYKWFVCTHSSKLAFIVSCICFTCASTARLNKKPQISQNESMTRSDFKRANDVDMKLWKNSPHILLSSRNSPIIRSMRSQSYRRCFIAWAPAHCPHRWHRIASSAFLFLKTQQHKTRNYNGLDKRVAGSSRARWTSPQ